MLLKFCGITRQEDLDAAASLKATHCGFIFHPSSPRFIAPGKAAKLNSHDLIRTGVFVNTDLSDMRRIAREARLDLLQLHGNQSVETAREFGADRIIKVLWPDALAEEELLMELDKWANHCSLFLTDAGKNGGGSGSCLNWKKLDSLFNNRSWLLAGGLCADNLSRALAECAPTGIDVNSGVELGPGIKNVHDMAKVAKIILKKDLTE